MTDRIPFAPGDSIVVAYVGQRGWRAKVERLQWTNEKTCLMTVVDECGIRFDFTHHFGVWRSLIGRRKVLIGAGQETTA